MDITLPLGVYRLTIQATSRIHFNQYSGSAWRGLFGHSLKRLTCVTHARDCRGCMLYASCVYAYIFETPPPDNSVYMRRATAAPHPFVLSPDPQLRTLESGESTHFNLTVAGQANRYLPYLIHALDQAGERGLGPNNGQYRLRAIEQAQYPGSDTWHAIWQEGNLTPLPPADVHVPPLPQHLVLNFESPLRLNYQGRKLSPDAFIFRGLIANLLRRYSMISYFHNHRSIELDFKQLVAQAGQVHHRAADLRWHDWARYSSRQRKRIKMGGVVGQVEYLGSDIETFWPLLWIGQWLHLGKGTSMGLGRYRIMAGQLNDARNQAA